MKNYAAALRGEIIMVTPEGLEAIHQRIAALRVEKADLEERLGLDAKDYPDLRENATYGDLSMKIQLDLPHQMDGLREMLQKATVTKAASKDRIGFGSSFKAKIGDNQPSDFLMTGPAEITLLAVMDESVQPISYLSPLGRAVWGLKAGQAGTLKLGAREQPVEIVQIHPLDA